jgi:hypothetical protein
MTYCLQLNNYKYSGCTNFEVMSDTLKCEVFTIKSEVFHKNQIQR